LSVLYCTDNYKGRSYEQIRTLEEIIDRDKAGTIFSPKVRLHENVAVLDYDDEYANIIINENISYETVRENKRPNNARLGILPIIVKQIMDRRVYVKQMLTQLSGLFRKAPNAPGIITSTPIISLIRRPNSNAIKYSYE
jgi:DNA polymerase elongation subunit (family B)